MDGISLPMELSLRDYVQQLRDANQGVARVNGNVVRFAETSYGRVSIQLMESGIDREAKATSIAGRYTGKTLFAIGALMAMPVPSFHGVNIALMLRDEAAASAIEAWNYTVRTAGLPGVYHLASRSDAAAVQKQMRADGVDVPEVVYELIDGISESAKKPAIAWWR